MLPRRRSRRLTPEQLIALSFALAILVGTVLLALSATDAPGRTTTLLSALFIATSAVCVTGLVVIDPASSFNLFGELVIMVLVQLGGLGILTFGTLFASVQGRRIGVEERLRVAQQVNVESIGGIVGIVRGIFAFTIITELLGALLLYPSFARLEGPGWGAYYALFHSVSAFNNAGFALYPDNLIRFGEDPLVLLVTSALFMLGGIGYLVMLSTWLWSRHPRRHHLPLNTQVALSTTLGLIVFGVLSATLLEWNNPKTLGEFDTLNKLVSGYYLGVAPRTAGFNAVDYALLSKTTLFITILLMFVGGNPGSTAGGVKTTSFFVLVCAVWNAVHGRSEVYAFRRRVALEDLLRAMVVTVIGLLVVTIAVVLLLLSNPSLPFINLLFEAFSAFATVGLSMNTTPLVSPVGQLVLIVLMFLGRIGPLTFAIALARRQHAARVRYPEDKSIVIG